MFILELKRKNLDMCIVHIGSKLFLPSSVTIIVAYLMKSRGMKLSEAPQHVKNKRPKTAPNRGFIRQLEDFEKSLQEKPAPKKQKVEVELGTRSVEPAPSYIKINHLKDPVNPLAIMCDAKLKEIFGCESISALEIPEVLGRHHIFRRS
ncbi:unnamed protein product [Vicia faba]|uniref:protein-tyrosine-phosphatase n=1 Tax=Vicia faba TaxID=3906 RepID=A0AAV1AH71_VICFA|nr:unnamed protein product [Vicia faba]